MLFGEEPTHYGEKQVKNILDVFPKKDFFFSFSIEHLPNVYDLDLLMIHRHAGAFALEIKAIPIEEILEISLTTIEIRGRGKKVNPNIQAYKAMTSFREYCNKRKIATPFFVASTVYPLIESNEWKFHFKHNRELRELSEKMIFKDDLLSPILLECKLAKIYANPPIRGGSNRKFIFSQEIISELNKALNIKQTKPTPPSISKFKSKAREQRNKLQKKFSFNKPTKLVFEGIPGSGKTYSLLTLADMFGTEGYSVIFLCYNKALATQLQINIDSLAKENGDPELSSFVSVYDIFQHASLYARAIGIEQINADNYSDWLDLIREDIENISPSAVGSAEILLVDEVQDFDSAQIRWVEYWANRASTVAVARGVGQEIYNPRENNEYGWLEKYHKEYLTVNYRNPGKLFLLSYLIGKAELNPKNSINFQNIIKKEISEKKIGIQRKEEFGFTIEGIDDSSSDRLVNDYIEIIKRETSNLTRAGKEAFQLLILVRGRKAKSIITETLEKLNSAHGIESFNLLEEDLRRQPPSADKIRVTTFESARGLEADSVIIFGFEQLKLGDPHDANLALIALSRATQKCILTQRHRAAVDLREDLEIFLLSVNELTHDS